MNMSPRQEAIVTLARDQGFVTVEVLADRFSVSPQTIRRDVGALCDAGLLRRRHGGVERVEATVNLAYGARRLAQPEAKRRIGALVAGLIPNRASVMLSIGTTPEMVASCLTEHDDLTVVTNNLNVAMILSGNVSNRIFIPGGMLRLPDRDLLGPQVEAMFAGYRADFGVFGVGGIEPDGVLVDFDRAECLARAAIRASCRRAILVADRSKFARSAPAHEGRLEDVDLLVLDGPPEGELAALIARTGVETLFPEMTAEGAA